VRDLEEHRIKLRQDLMTFQKRLLRQFLKEFKKSKEDSINLHKSRLFGRHDVCVDHHLLIHVF
jgi:hypothetical protein